MAKCEVCGNDYYLSFEVIAAGERHVFDSFECAIHRLAPVCAHCGCKVIGHGVEGKNEIFCCATCAGLGGVFGVMPHACGRGEGTFGAGWARARPPPRPFAFPPARVECNPVTAFSVRASEERERERDRVVNRSAARARGAGEPNA